MTLTIEQIQAIRDGEPVRLILPEVGEECVVVRATEYADSSMPSPGLDPRQAYAAIDEAWSEDWDAPGMEEYDRYEEHRK